MDGQTSGLRPRELTRFIDPLHTDLTIARQAELIGLPLRSYYYQPVENSARQDCLKSQLNAVDEIYTKYPFYGTRRIKYELNRSYGMDIGRERIRRLMAQLGLEAIYPKPNTSKAGIGAGHQIYPYLLRGVTADYPNHIWGTDITYIRTAIGFVYLVAFMDWYSRYVVSWTLSDSLENTFVLQALRDGLQFTSDCGLPMPEIINSDQGSNFTAQAYIEMIQQTSARVSMDGKGRYLDNIFTERLWRSVKYENVFLKSYQNIHDARVGLDEYFSFYNHIRPHQAIDNRLPATVYFEL